MANIEEMIKWNYAKAWKFFTENAFGRLIPETVVYIGCLSPCTTEDVRGCPDAREKILNSLKENTLILIDGASLNGKTTFAKRLAKKTNASVVDIDLLCKDWIEVEYEKITNPNQIYSFIMNIDKLTDVYILDNLERIIRGNSKNGSVILVGSYMELIYRSIIVRTLGKYFHQVVSIYCCALTSKEVKKMKEKRDQEFGYSAENVEEILNQYNYSKKLLENNGIALGLGMAASFIVDNGVSDMFV